MHSAVTAYRHRRGCRLGLDIPSLAKVVTRRESERQGTDAS